MLKTLSPLWDSTFFRLVMVAVLAGLLAHRAREYLRNRRCRFIDDYIFPEQVLARCQKESGYSEKALHTASLALQQFYRMHARSPKKEFAMPSKAADALWHTHILFTREYRAFCKKAFGRYLDHQPYRAHQQTDAPLRNSWYAACLDEALHPFIGPHVPRLFATDGDLGICPPLKPSELPWRSPSSLGKRGNSPADGRTAYVSHSTGSSETDGIYVGGSESTDSGSSCDSSCGGGCGGGGGCD
ncbi:glycine-rich domain-containing protein [Chitinibacteraceae bacterium HSL-7]